MNHSASSGSGSPPGAAGPARLSILGATDLAGTDGHAVHARALQPKRLVLLSYLSLASAPGFVRRDVLLSLFWPELPAEQARHALRQSLHYIRTTLGRDVVRGRGDTELAIDPDRLWCDARAFAERMEARDAVGAMALYRGDLLEGVFVSDAAPELEQWLDAERLRIRRMAATAAAEMAAASESAGDGASAISWARRAAALDPDDERWVRALLEQLDRQGDRAGALRAYAEFEQRLRREYDTSPSEQTRALRARIGRTSPLSGPPASAPIAPVPVMADEPAAPSPPSRRWFRLVPVAVGLLVIAAIALAFTTRVRPQSRAPEVLAVGTIVPAARGVLDDSALTLRGQLAAELSQLAGITVLSDGRLYEMVARARGSIDVRDHVLAAARRAGATELLDGVLRTQGSAYRLELQRVDLGAGVVRGTLVLEGSRLADLAAQATSRIAQAHRLPTPVRSLGALMSQSPVARRSYERGMRALYAGDRAGAIRHFGAALEVDPRFFAAAYFAFLVTPLAELGDTLRQHLLHAVAAADSAPERERLQIRTLWSLLTNDPRGVAYAESLASRYPAEPEGRYYLGQALASAGHFSSALEQVQAGIAVDSVLLDSALSGDAPCRVCQAMAQAAQIYIFMDSIPAAHRWVNAWQAASSGRQPDVIATRAVLYGISGRRDEALAIVRDSMTPTERSRFAPSLLVEAAIRIGDFAEAERLIASDLASDDAELRRNGLWWDVIYHHTRGRLEDAMAAADRFCAEPGSPEDDCAQIRASLLVQIGRAQQAASGMERRLRVVDRSASELPGARARRLTWLLAHLAEARAALRDTAGLARLADSIETVGRLSAYGRDRRMHNHVRGLLYSLRGTHDRAADAFRLSEFSPTYGFGQARFRWATSLLALGRAEEAVQVLDPLRRRVLTSVGSYLSQAEVHLLLARALAEAGRLEAARTELAWVERAWEGADRTHRARLADAREVLGTR